MTLALLAGKSLRKFLFIPSSERPLIMKKGIYSSELLHRKGLILMVLPVG
ncbi:hypothetical protein ABID95_005607 [Streptomyces atratus]